MIVDGKQPIKDRSLQKACLIQNHLPVSRIIPRMTADDFTPTAETGFLALSIVLV